MRTPFTPASCLMDAYRKIFPTLDFSQIDYYFDDTVNQAAHPGYARPSLGRTAIGINPKDNDPCNPGLFQILLHELVHALQQQTMGYLVSGATSVVCQFFYGTGRDAYQHNCKEVEAYGFVEKWIDALQPTKFGSPCTCSTAGTTWGAAAFGPVPTPGFLEAIDAAIAHDSTLAKTEAGCPPSRCMEGSFVRWLVGVPLTAASILVLIAGARFNEGTAEAVGTIAGAIGGAAAGATAAAAFGGIGGAIGGGLFGAIVGGFLGGIVGAIIHWLGGGGGHGGSLNLMFSQNEGRDFTQKVTFERSREQPALAFTGDKLAVGWTGIDSRLNVFLAPDKHKTVIEKTLSCGPGLAFGAGRFFLAWEGTDGHPNCLFSPDGVSFSGKFTSGGDSPREATPGVAAGNGRTYVAWVGSDNHIRLIHLASSSNPLTEIPISVHRLAQTTGHQGTPALAFGDNRLFLAWSSFAASHCLLNVMDIPVSPDGSLLPLNEEAHKVVLSDWTNDTTGPALAFSPHNHRLYLAFTGADDSIWILSSTDGGKTFPNRTRLPNERSRTDAGPVVAAHADGTVCVCWVGTDGD